MKNIRSKNTIPERMVMNELKKRKIYFTKHVDGIFGKPDIVFRRKKVVVFIDSDFWHYNPERFIMPATNLEYWQKKIIHNKKRDEEVNTVLKLQGWKVIRIWEYDVKHDLQGCISFILETINGKTIK